MATFMVDLKGYGVGMAYLHAQAVGPATPGGRGVSADGGRIRRVRTRDDPRARSRRAGSRACFRGSVRPPDHSSRQGCGPLPPISGRASVSSGLRSFMASALGPSRSSRRSWPLRRSSAPQARISRTSAAIAVSRAARAAMRLEREPQCERPVGIEGRRRPTAPGAFASQR